MNILIIGHGRHGKDTVAELLSEYYGLKFCSSSEFVSEHYIFDKLKDKYGYKNHIECFNDRSNHRAEWYDLICEYNKNDKCRLAKAIFEVNDCYVGMRDHSEIRECKDTGLVDIVIWVDASGRLPDEPNDSFNITHEDADFIIPNNGSLDDLKERVFRIGAILYPMVSMSKKK